MCNIKERKTVKMFSYTHNENRLSVSHIYFVKKYLTDPFLSADNKGIGKDKETRKFFYIENS